MNSLTQSKKTILPVLIALMLGCFALSPAARAVDPPPKGGYPNQNTAESDDALYSNITGSDNALTNWSWRVTGGLNTARLSHTATLLQNGMVLVAGGDRDGKSTASAELYDPASGTWTATGSLNTGREYYTATLLRNGMVLVEGGVDGIGGQFASAEVYDPANRTWRGTGSLNTARWQHTATLLQNGNVVVAGGLDANGRVLASAELGHGPR